MADSARVAADEGLPRKERIIAQATHLLRYQLYVGRSDIDSLDGTDGSTVYMFAQIHIRAAMRMYFSRHSYSLGGRDGLLEPGDVLKDGTVFDGVQYVASLTMMPPRHGKTDLVIHDIALTINQRPRIQMAIIHDKESEASKVLRAVQNLMDIKTSQGRRNARLYPGVELTDYDNNQTTLRVVNDKPPRNPNLIAASVWVSGQGNNLDRVYGDDLVPQSDKTEHNRREQRKTRFAGTWLSRLQGKKADVVLTGYPRHHDDLMWTYYKEALAFEESNGANGMRIMALRVPVGGPKSLPQFHAIWPEMYDHRFLKSKHRQLNNASLWAANYELSPITEEQQIVHEIRLVDVADQEIERFLKTATYHLSVDPAAKGDGTGDKAGVLVGALGDMLRVEHTDAGDVIYEEKMLLVVHADEFYATQTQLTEHMVAMTSKYPIDTAHIEHVTGLGSAMAEALETHYGISRVELHGVANKGKAARLRAVAPLLENSNQLAVAKVAFLGRKQTDEDGEVIPNVPLVICKEFKLLESYVINFAVESGYHSLDCLTQLLKHLVQTGELAPHEGEFAMQASRGMFQVQRTQKLRRLREAAQSYADQQPEEYAYFGDSNTSV